jgi:hypothetical protein
MNMVASLILMAAILGGLAVFLRGVCEAASRLFGCMRYTYGVTGYDYESKDFYHYTFETCQPLGKNVRLGIRAILSKKEPTVVAISIVEIGKKSVLAQTVWRGLYRAFTRSADDAVCEWKERKGIS